MPADYHMHTPLCRHATGTVEEYVARARELGLPEIGFSDHSPMPSYFDDFETTMSDIRAKADVEIVFGD